MSGQIPPEFEQKTSQGRAGSPDSIGEAGATPVGATSTPGYGGYGGYGYGNASIGGDSDLSLVHYLQVLYRRRYIAASAFLSVVVLVALHTFTATPIYEASTRILIEREDPNVVSFKQVLDQSTLTDDYYETQYAILHSRGLARRSLAVLNLWNHPAFNPEPKFSIRGFLMKPVDLVVGLFAPPPVELPDSGETAEQTAVIDRFLGSLEVSPVRYSRLVDVTFRSTDPAVAARAANVLAEQYISQTIELRSNTTKDASVFLEQQLAEQRTKLEASERALQAYRERTDSVSLEDRQNIVVQKLQELNAAVTRANTARIQKEAAYNQVKAAQNDPKAIESLPLILSNQFVQQQKTELAQLQRQRAQLSEKLGPNHPDMVKVNIAIQNAEAKLRAEVAQIVDSSRSEYEAAVSEERTLTASLDRQKQEAQSLNRSGIQYGVLERDATANRQMFGSLLQRTQETGVSQELKSVNVRVVDPAEIPTGPSSPNVFNNLLMGILAGLTLALGLAFAFEYADDRIKNPDELKKHLGVPFLGMVPALFGRENGSSPILSDGVSAIFSESFRSIRTNVLFSSTEEGGRFIVITSSVPGEGKTVVSTNLSVALAQAGHRVLLIDADMRKPRVHDVFRARMAPGLSNLLVGNASASESIVESSTSGLWLMPAGTLPPNPAELLGSKRFKDFVAFLVQHFDWVIIDSPPVMAVTDAAIVANLAQGVLFVVGAEMTSRRVAQRAVEQLELSQARMLGVVLNRVDLEHNPYYYSRYYRPEYGGYYGPPSGPAATGGHGGFGVGADASAPRNGIGAEAARVAGAAARVASVALSLGGRIKAFQNFRIERHL